MARNYETKKARKTKAVPLLLSSINPSDNHKNVSVDSKNFLKKTEKKQKTSIMMLRPA